MTTIYFDFLCPFAWRGLELVALLQQHREFPVVLKHYSLVQGNHPENPERKQPQWWLTDQDARSGGDHQQDSLAAFLAGHAAAQQGEAARLRFSLELFQARHAGGASLSDPATLEGAAERAGLDLARFRTDLADDAARRQELHAELQDAAALGVFGTPTYQLQDGGAAYFRFAQLPDHPEEAAHLWDLYLGVLASGARIETIKRPR